MGNIFCIGQSAYDIIIPLTEPIVENQKYRIKEKFECGGGPAFNASYLCGLWGVNTYLVSRFGRDEYGQELERLAKKVKVHLDYMIPDEKIHTPHSYIFSNSTNGTRTLFNFPGERSETEYEYPAIPVDVILSDGHEPEISLEAIRHYKEAISIVDAGTCRESTLAVARKVDYLVCSEDFARQYTGKEILLKKWDLCEEIFEEVEAINGKHVVITLGDQGLLYRQDKVLKHMPAYKVRAVDTNGAGDVFHGAFAYGISKNMPLSEVLKISSMAAAISIESLGGQPSIPELETVYAKLALAES